MAITLPKGLLADARHIRAAVGFTQNHTFLLSITAAPGECFWYTADELYRVGVQMRLYAIVPAGALACAQFAPKIRHQWTLAHRVNVYLVLLLSLTGTAGAVVIAPVAFGGGGDLCVRGQIGAIAVMFLGSLAVAWYFISRRRRRIDQHRAWMLRAWFYASHPERPFAGSIVTVKLVMSIAARIVSSGDGKGGYYAAMPCRQLESYMDATVLARKYPACASLDAWVLVKADMGARSPEQISAALSVSFGMALWMAFIVHAVGVKFYLQLTPGETKRLRELSLRRVDCSD
ncbi:hypothetical protein ISF_06566 [Cordyceps fumosorosea ARSEF 2679]|uniref:Uncharacterized protein n=1 Tax=Cordyceps fumosorosea (strain ARSEF 2679) TaxID=1081104 RepID=A0A167RP00_CORFA|nr:hypothetical protein ISF_06566 [Cordyceps fumosorosea ARSEF 2679]OAA58783.1 hypothetical protein ISF_06566 [Cordyceps fumosorosea ARSEF 2679]